MVITAGIGHGGGGTRIVTRSNDVALANRLGRLQGELVVYTIIFIINIIISLTCTSHLVSLLATVNHSCCRFISVTPRRGLVRCFHISVLTNIIIAIPITFCRVCTFTEPNLGEDRDAFFGLIVLLNLVLFYINILFTCGLVVPFVLHFLDANVRNTRCVRAAADVRDCIGLYLAVFVVFNYIFRVPLVAVVLSGVNVVGPRLLGRIHNITVIVVFFVTTIIAPPSVISRYVITNPVILLCFVDVLLDNVFCGPGRSSSSRRSSRSRSRRWTLASNFLFCRYGDGNYYTV